MEAALRKASLACLRGVPGWACVDVGLAAACCIAAEVSVMDGGSSGDDGVGDWVKSLREISVASASCMRRGWTTVRGGVEVGNAVKGDLAGTVSGASIECNGGMAMSCATLALPPRSAGLMLYPRSRRSASYVLANGSCTLG